MGRPLVVDADTGASFRARGVGLDSPGALGVLLRQRPQEVLDHYRAEVRSQVDVLCALTADTTPRALAEVGMEHRSAMLTGLAVESLGTAAESTSPSRRRRVGSEMCDRWIGSSGEELGEHAARLKPRDVAVLARGQAPARANGVGRSRHARTTDLGGRECPPNGRSLPWGALLRCSPRRCRATVLLLEVSSSETAFARWKRDCGSRAQLHPPGLAPGFCSRKRWPAARVPGRDASAALVQGA